MNVDEFLARFINNSLLKKMPFWIVMFILTNIGWWFFRMNGLDQATHFFSNTQNMNLANQVEASKLIWIALFIAADHFFYSYQKDIFRFLLPRPIAIGCLWALLLVLITVLGAREATEFIYFQF